MNTKLRELRLELGLTQKELAKQIGSTDKNIWAYEKGNIKPPIETLIAYAKFFGVTVDYLLGLEDDFGSKVATMGASSTDYTAEERQLIEDFRNLNYYKQQLIKNNIKAMLPAEAESEQKKKG